MQVPRVLGLQGVSFALYPPQYHQFRKKFEYKICGLSQILGNIKCWKIVNGLTNSVPEYCTCDIEGGTSQKKHPVHQKIRNKVSGSCWVLSRPVSGNHAITRWGLASPLYGLDKKWRRVTLLVS